MDRVKSGTPPKINYEVDAEYVMKNFYNTADPSLILNADEDIDNLVDEYHTVSRDYNAAKKLRDSVKAQILEKSGGASKIVSKYGTIHCGMTRPNKGTLITSIRQTLPDGWHTYWKNPGDSGAKASIKTTNQNVEFGELEFPKPTLLTLDPLITFGYKNDVTYKLPVNIIDQTDSVSATFHWLECAEVCIPKSQKITFLTC